MKKYVLLAFLLISAATAYCQVKSTEHFDKVWLGYFSQLRFSNKLGVWTDIQLRTKDDWVDGIAQQLYRLGLTYYVTDNVKLTAGYAYIVDLPADNHKNISTYEHRPWQQVQWHTNYGKQRMMQWFRLEQRYRRKILNDDALGDGYNFNWRLRYNFLYEIPFYKNGSDPKSWSFILNDEVHINFGRQIVNNYFDQNRFFAGFKYQLNTHSSLQFGYMNWFQQLAAGNRYRNSNIARVFFFQNFDFRKKK